ncbi:MAG: phosphoribosyl-ATP diphosphatase, partial [Gemmatimonadetes bacterium]|nr:phosphoribosyl-ATP diphosphatase [Gemmatimonadota bacterium]
TLALLDNTLARRSSAGSNRSYTVQLLNDSNLRLKKLGEETAELVAALATGHQERAVEEAADLVYHLLVALRADGSGLAALLNELG